MRSSGWDRTVRVARVFFGVLALVAVGVNLRRGLAVPTFRVSNYFSYFTILSNLFAGIVLITGGLLRPVGRRWDFVRGACALCMVVTGLVYNTLLVNLPLGVTAPWINDVLHRVGPLVLLLDWLIVPPRKPVGYGGAAGWLLIPLAYFAYSLIRGPLVGQWYPYPFVNPTLPGGYGKVLLTCVVVGVVMAGVAFFLAFTTVRRRRPAR